MSLNSQSTYCSSSPFSRGKKKSLNQSLDKRLTFLTTWPQTKRQKSGRWKHDHAHLSDLTIKDRSPMLHVWSQSVHRRPLFFTMSCVLFAHFNLVRASSSPDTAPPDTESHPSSPTPPKDKVSHSSVLHFL